MKTLRLLSTLVLQGILCYILINCIICCAAQCNLQAPILRRDVCKYFNGFNQPKMLQLIDFPAQFN